MHSLNSVPPRDHWNRYCLVLFLALWAMSCIGVPYPKYLPIQHVPTVAAVVALALVDRRSRISPLSYTLILGFLSLHLLGARYLYSYVPYDEWSHRLLGYRITEVFGFERNHYDRLVHVGFGLFILVPIRRFLRRFVGLGNSSSAMIAVALIMAASATYEICEWLVAIIMAPDWADSYNGQQGDPWDAQADLLMALCGAFVAAAVACWRDRRLATNDS